MKKIYFFLMMLLAASGVWGQTHRTQAAFTPGNLVVFRAGDGAVALAATGTAIFLDEYSTIPGPVVQSIALPTAPAGANKRIVCSGTATSEGFVTRSINGQYLVLAGYDAALGTASIATSLSTAVNRVIGIVDPTGTINSSTALTDAISGGNPRGVCSTNGTDLWISGTSTAGGIRYATAGATTSLALAATPTNLRASNIYSGQLYISANTGTTRVATVGAGTPTTAGQTITNLPGFPTTGSPYGFFLADINPGVAGDDVLYVADDVAGLLQKYSLVAGSWTANGTISIASVRGLTGRVMGSTVFLYFTSPTILGGLTDVSGYNATIAGAPFTIATAPSNTAFRGVAFAPVTPCAAPTVQATNITFTGNTDGTLGTVAWTNGNGATRVLVMNTSNTFTPPVDGTEFLGPSNVYGGSGEQVMYVGSLNNESISGLTPGTQYYFRVFEYNCNAPNSKYNTSTAANNPNALFSYNNQYTADYRTSGAGSGNYNDPASWQYNYTGVLYQTPADGPGGGNDVTIRNGHTITMTAAGNADMLTLEATGNMLLGNNDLSVNGVTGGSSTGYIQTNGTGSLSIPSIGATDVVFPVGPNGTLYHPVTINNAGVLNGFSVNLVAGSAPACIPGVASVSETWNIREARPGGSNCTLTFDFTGAATGPSFTASGAQITHCTGAVADYHNGSVTGSVATGSGFTSFSPFGITNDRTVLPVSFGTVRASQQGTGVKVEWSNLTETAILNYSVERSADGSSFTGIGTVTAVSNNGGKADYTFIDATPVDGANYYRINARGTTGSNKYSIIVKVNTKGGKTDFTVYPNPVTGNQVSFQATALPKGQYTVKVMNAAGQQVFSRSLLHNGGSVTEVLQLPATIKTGMYSIQLTGGDVNLTKTFIIR